MKLDFNTYKNRIYGCFIRPEKWSTPIQDMITTCCINLPVGGIEIPKTVTELTDRILRLTPLFLAVLA